MHDAFYNQMKCTMYLVMEMVQGQSMTQMLEGKAEQDRSGFDNEINCEALRKPKTDKFTEEECKYIFMQLLDVIDYLSCEEIGICHRDINPNNIMLDLEQGNMLNNETSNTGKAFNENRCSYFEDNTKEKEQKDNQRFRE